LAASAPGAPRAYELKFRIDPVLAAAVEDWARRRLGPDAHGDPALGGAYLTTSLYLDTPALDVYHRTPGFRARKFRIRRYGGIPMLFLERKTKRGDRVRKRRACISDADLHLLTATASDEAWPGHWFHRRILSRGLAPAAIVSYRRTALVGTCTEGPLRLTLDREVRGVIAGDWRLAGAGDSTALLPDWVILELKFLDALPHPFKELVMEFGLSPTPVSKYRLCRDAAALVSHAHQPAGGPVRAEVPVA
jgi:hypothetical protein